MSNISYRIELKPIGDFFFGGENTFGESSPNDANSKKNYFAQSNKFPQQSALLGMLRFELLKERQLLPISGSNKEKVKELIGEKSFDFNRNCNEFDFGIIKNISPVFLTDGSRDFIATPLDYAYKDSIKWLSNRVYLSGRTKQRQIDFASFDVKTHSNETQYVGTKDRSLHNESVFFETNIKTGVNTIKIREAEDDKDAFFKQEFVSLKAEHRFAFYAEFNESLFEDESLHIVSLGGEQSMFSLKIKKAANSYEQGCKRLFEVSDRIILISDAYISLEQKNVIDQAADFSFSDTLVFRNIQTSITKNNYANKPTKSNKIHLLKKGSVFYYSSKIEKKEIIESLNNVHLQSCGFNLYID